MPDFALYRDKENENYRVEAENFVQMSKSFKRLKSFLHRDYNLAHTLGSTGVHLTSTQFDDIPKAKALGLEVIISTHTFGEVAKAEKLGADYVTYSPIFPTPNKGEPKGVADLQKVITTSHINIFALGGIIDEKQIQEIENTGAFGFASIRYFL